MDSPQVKHVLNRVDARQHFWKIGQHDPWAGPTDIKPNCALFDLGQDIVQHENPMSLSGWPTEISIDPSDPFHTSYRIVVAPGSLRRHASPFLAPYLHSEASPT